MQAVLVDTCVWLAIFDPRDTTAPRGEVAALAELIQEMTVVVPWPVTYETMRTRMVKKEIELASFERLLKSEMVAFIDDAPYRQAALEHSFNSSIRWKRPLSLVDCLLRLIISDKTTCIDYMATHNRRDFFDVCTRRRIEMIPDL